MLLLTLITILDPINGDFLALLMEKHGDTLFSIAYNKLKDRGIGTREDAEELVQETFLKAYRHLNAYRGDSSEKTWLTAICINVCRDMLRTPWFKHQSRMDIDQLPEKPAAFAFPDDTVLTEVMGLPAKYREVILLRYYGGLKLKEVAGALRLSVGKVRNRLDKANRILRDRLKEWYYDEGP